MSDSQTSIISVLASRPARAVTAAMLAVALTAAPALSPVSAYAASAATQEQLDAAADQVESSAQAYADAVAKLDDLQQQIDENSARIAEIEAELPEKQDAASSAVRDMYKLRSGSSLLVNMVVNAQSLSDFISTYFYMDQIQSANNKAISDLSDLQQELEQKQTKLDQARTQLESERQVAAQALETAQQMRAEAQAKAEQEEAAELAQLAELQKTDPVEAAAPATGSGADSENTANTATQTGQTVTTTVPSGGVDWNDEYTSFINEWTTRIDNYLAGSPLAGYGRTFAEAAWNSGVDPRWSPAIAAIESTKGTYCFRPFNAWGWMGKSFSSWEEAIPEHVAYLRRVYGTTITTAAAQKYCPPTWQDWYNKVSAQMNRI